MLAISHDGFNIFINKYLEVAALEKPTKLQFSASRLEQLPNCDKLLLKFTL